MRDDSGPSDNIEIMAMGRCPQGHHFLELRIVVGGWRRRRILSMEEFEAAPERMIASLEAGLTTQSSRTDFRRRVQEALRTLRPTFRVATRPGWYGRSFVLPSGEVFGDEPNLRVCLPSIYREFGEKFASRGTLQRWQRIPELAVGNRAFMIALGARLLRSGRLSPGSRGGGNSTRRPARRRQVGHRRCGGVCLGRSRAGRSGVPRDLESDEAHGRESCGGAQRDSPHPRRYQAL